jgi:hypothetical protein
MKRRDLLAGIVATGADRSAARSDRTTAAGPAQKRPPVDPLVTIKAGGTVNFVIAGFHNPAVYGPGVKPEDINATITIPVPGAPAGFPPLIDDATKRIYRGPNPFPLPQDRTEVVHLPKKGLYLCLYAALRRWHVRLGTRAQIDESITRPPFFPRVARVDESFAL